MARPSVSVAERRARLAVRHRLVASAREDDDPAGIAHSVVALHASDPSTVVLSVLARMREPDAGVVERALYDDRSLVRMLAMRRTLWTVPTADLPLVHAAGSLAVAATERSRFLKLVEDAGISTAPGRWVRAREREALAVLEDLHEATASEISAAAPKLAIQIPVNQGKRYQGSIGVGTRVLLLLAADGRIVRGRPRGAWTSSLHRWSTVEHWLGAPIEARPVEASRQELARRWLARFGPATVADLTWWTGWTLGQTRAALAGLDTEVVDLDGTDGLVLAGDAESAPAPDPWVALLPSLDPTTMGWRARDWYLGPHKAQVFDSNGNAGATVWADGRIVGGWAQRQSGEIAVQLLEDIGRERGAAVADAAALLEATLGEVRVTPRFPAALDKELVR